MAWGHLKPNHFDQLRLISEDGYPRNHNRCLEFPECLIYFHPLANKSSIRLAGDELRWIKGRAFLPHWNSSAPSSQSFWPSHSHTLEMQFPLGQAKWPSSHLWPWETWEEQQWKNQHHTTGNLADTRYLLHLPLNLTLTLKKWDSSGN